MASKLEVSPIGMALHAYVGKPDNKYNPDNPVYKLKLILSGDEAEALKAKIDAKVDEAYEAHISTLPVAQKNLWSTSYPYEDELDQETGEPTGRTIFKFKQNSRIKRRDGTITEVKILVVDSKKRKTNVPVFSGAEVRVGYKFRSNKDGTIYPSIIAASKNVSVRLDFSQVQLIKPALRGDGSAFDEVEGGWEADEDEFSPNQGGSTSSATSSDGDF